MRNITAFITQIILLFKESVSRNSLETLLNTNNPDGLNNQLLLNSGISLMVGFIFLTNQNRVSTWIEKNNAKNAV